MRIIQLKNRGWVMFKGNKIGYKNVLEEYETFCETRFFGASQRTLSIGTWGQVPCPVFLFEISMQE